MEVVAVYNRILLLQNGYKMSSAVPKNTLLESRDIILKSTKIASSFYTKNEKRTSVSDVAKPPNLGLLYVAVLIFCTE